MLMNLKYINYTNRNGSEKDEKKNNNVNFIFNNEYRFKCSYEKRSYTDKSVQTGNKTGNNKRNNQTG